MDRVGVRELRQNPTPALQAVEAGAEVTVTVNGRAVARLVPIESVTWVEGAYAEQIYAARVDETWAGELQRAREDDTVDDPWA